MKCPVCNKHELVTQSLEDSYGREPDQFCPEIVTMPGGKVLNHYREFLGAKEVRIIVPPYRIVTENGTSKVSIQSRYRSGNREYYFKTLLKIPALHPDSQERLLERIKLLMLLS